MTVSDARTRLIRVFLSELDERLGAFDADLVALEAPAPEAERAETVTRLFRGAHSLKGAAASVGASGIELVCQHLEDVLAKVRDGASAVDAALHETLATGAAQLRDAARTMAGNAAPAAAPAPAPTPAPTPAPAAAPAQRVTTRVHVHDNTLRVPADRIDALLEQSGELLVIHHRIDELLRNMDETTPLRMQLQRASKDLDEAIRAIRVVPFGIACEGLERVVADAAQASGKRARLEIEGADVGIDRVMIERLRDPLVQLVRNAVGHGIEAPGERVALGKPPEGIVKLWVAPREHTITVRVTDDGRGLDLDRLRERVRERGLEIEESDLANAIFLPGITTAASVTKLSGRGVGLDVVRNEVEALNGTAEVLAEPNGGTTFILSFPLTISTLRVLLVAAAEQTFGINVMSVERVLRIDPAAVSQTEGRPVLVLDERSVPLVPLHAALGIASDDTREVPPYALVVTRGANTVALAVDAVLDEREVHLRSLGPRLRGLPHVTGASVAGDGSLALILRGTAVIESALRVARTVRVAQRGEAAPAAAKRVLLVDDSVTTRALERSILEAAGFNVLTAPDGRAAWTLLGEQSVDLVVTDVDMPEMNGFQLIESIRASTTLRELPVIMVTARENDADRQRGLDIGADAYIVKSGFRQEALLDAIGALT